MRAVFLVSLLAAGLGWFAVRHERAKAAEARYAAVASAIAGRPVHVHCQGAVGAAIDVSGEAGTVDFDARGRPADVTDLKRFVCQDLARVSADLKKPAFDCIYFTFACSQRIGDEMQALHTLAHESWHLAGVMAESDTECHALHSVAYVAERFGADSMQAHAIAHWVALEIYPVLPDAYHASDCPIP